MKVSVFVLNYNIEILYQNDRFNVFCKNVWFWGLLLTKYWSLLQIKFQISLEYKERNRFYIRARKLRQKSWLPIWWKRIIESRDFGIFIIIVSRVFHKMHFSKTMPTDVSKTTYLDFVVGFVLSRPEKK